MHLAFAITEYFPFGGAQRDFFAVASEMAKRGHRITVITGAWHGAVPDGWQTIIVDKNRFRTNHARLRGLSDKILALQSEKTFDAVIGFTKMAGLDIYFAADPSFIAHRYYGLKKWLPRYRTYAGIEREMFANTQLKVFFLTEVQRQAYLSAFFLPASQQAILPVSVEPEFHFSEEKYRQARQYRRSEQPEAGRYVLLFIAADFDTKGLDRVISALKQLTHAQREHLALWIVGNGKQGDYESGISALSGLKTRFWGGQKSTAWFYFAADMLVHPARKEAAGMVIAEALAAHLPVCISSVCGYRFLASDDPHSTVLLAGGEVHGLAQQIGQLADRADISRGQGSPQISRAPRAVFCADQIETWLDA